MSFASYLLISVGCIPLMPIVAQVLFTAAECHWHGIQEVWSRLFIPGVCSLLTLSGVLLSILSSSRFLATGAHVIVRLCT